MKTCKQCGIPQDTSAFSLHRSVCKACKKLYLAQYRKDHKDHLRELEYKWIVENRERVNARSRRLRLKPSYKIRNKKYRVKYKQAHLKEHAESEALRRARKNASPVIEKIDRDLIYKRDKGVCQLCHTKVLRKDMSTDHVIPLADGGEHSYRNIVLAHTLCNIRKGKRRVTQQMRLLG